MERTVQHSAFPLMFLKADGADTGSFVGYASVYGNEDLQGDVVERGAFTKTIQERPTVKILFNHNPNLPIGKGRIEDSPTGLLLHGDLNLDVATAREVYSNLKKGIIDSLSIGYEVLKSGRGAGGARLLRELRLFEVSLVTFPANQQARVLDVKAGDNYCVDADTFRRWQGLVRKMKSDLQQLNLQ